MTYELREKRPQTLGSDHYIAPNATVIGDVTLHAGATVWFGEGMRIPDGYLALGTPARPLRLLTDAEREMIRASARDYYERGKHYAIQLRQV